MLIAEKLKSIQMLLMSLCLLLPACINSPGLVVRGELHGEMVWQGTVYVEGDVTLGEDVHLTIQPGTRVLFLPPGNDPGNRTEHPYFPGSELNVKGRLYASGTPSEPIVFAAAQPEAGAGSWGAINIEGSHEAVFEFCIFRQADSAVHSRNSNVYIENSVFENNLVAVRFHDSEILVEHNLIRNNQTGVRFHFGSPVICENEFLDNNVNVFVTSYPREYRIENNSFGRPSEYQVVLGEQVPDDVLMPRNYWAQRDDVPLEQSFYDGRRSGYLGRVLIEPVRSTPSSQAGPSWNP